MLLSNRPSGPSNKPQRPSTQRPISVDFPVLRSRSANDACSRIGRLLSPHRLEVRGHPGALQVELNEVVLCDLSVRTLRYGTEVTIDPGRRGDHYLMQLPLRGRADVRCGANHVASDCGMLSVLQPQAPTLMHWSADCDMVLLQVPSDVVQRRVRRDADKPCPQPLNLGASRREPHVAAWWKAAEDIIANLDQHGEHWLGHRAAKASMEEFLLSAFTALLQPPPNHAASDTVVRSDERCLRRAKDYIHAHLNQALLLDDIARAACTSPRTLEAVFKRHEATSPLNYARTARLQAVHDTLRKGEGRSVTDVALSHGFVHMGRFAAQYRRQFGCPPSQTWRSAQ